MIGDVLKRLLKMRGMTQAELSRRTGISPKTINSIIKRNNKGVDFSIIEKICDTLEVPIESFKWQDVNDAATPGERVLNYMVFNGDSAKAIAELLDLSIEELNRIIAGDLTMDVVQAEILGEHYGVDPQIFLDDDADIEEKPVQKDGHMVEELIRRFQTLNADEQAQILGLVRVMSKSHEESRSPVG